MKTTKPKSERKPVIFISYSHRDEHAVYGLWKDLEKRTDSIRGLEIDVELGYKDSIEEHMRRPKVTDFAIAYISRDYFLSANCIDELMALFDRKNPREKPEERLLQVMEPNYKNHFDEKEREKIIQYWEEEKKDSKKVEFLKEKLLPMLKDEKYLDLKELRKENYQSIVEYIIRIMALENQESIKRLVEITFISNVEEREIALEKYKEENEADCYYYFLKGRFSSGKHKASEYYYTEAIHRKPDYAAAYNNRGNAYAAQGKHKEAIEDFNKAIRIDSADAAAYNNRGTTYEKQEKYEEAIKDYTQAIRLNPKLAEAYNNRGIAYDKQGKYEEAIKDYNETIRLKPDFATAFNNRGVTYDKQKKYEEAIRDFTEAIRLKPDFAEAYNNRGNVYLVQGKYEEAIKDYNEGIHLKPELAPAYYNRGGAYNNQGKHEEAIRDFTEAIRLKYDYLEAYYNRSLAYARIGETEKAKADRAMAKKLHPPVQ